MHWLVHQTDGWLGVVNDGCCLSMKYLAHLQAGLGCMLLILRCSSMRSVLTLPVMQYPNFNGDTPGERDDYTSLLQALRKATTKAGLLFSIAVRPLKMDQHYHMDQLAANTDFINVMSVPPVQPPPLSPCIKCLHRPATLCMMTCTDACCSSLASPCIVLHCPIIGARVHADACCTSSASPCIVLHLPRMKANRGT